MAPPQGIELSKGSTAKWRVGKKLGDGACATVHVLEEIDGSSTEWAIKLAPLPKKITKKASTPDEVNARLLHHESVMYANQFQDVQGKFVPRLPPYKGPPASGEAGGFRYVVLEKMASSLSDIVPTLMKRSQQSSGVSFGPIAVQLLNCIRTIHERKHVVVDVKEDNFMLALGNGKGASVEAKLASRIRILDLALVQPWASMDGHRANQGSSGMAGTPLYASLNVHKGETISRRDDLEALGYVMAELIVKIASGNPAMELPWSKGRSDEEIGELKASQVDNPSSNFYKQLGVAAGPIKDYITLVRGYSFKKTPDYQELSNILARIKIKCDITKKTTPTKTPTGASTTSTSATTRSKKSSLSPVPSSLTPSRMTRSRARARSPEGDSCSDNDSPHKMAREDSFLAMEVDAPPGAQLRTNTDVYEDHMDWEVISDENAAPEETETERKSVRGVTIVVQSGPEQGTAINLLQGQCDSIVVGRAPITKKGEGTLALFGDSQVDDNHARLELWVSKKMVAVNVTDLKSSAGTVYNRERIRSSMKIFVGDLLHLGSSSLKIVELDPSKLAAPPSSSKVKTTPKRMERRSVQTPAESPAAMEIDAAKPPAKRRGLRIRVIDGPHIGEVIEIEKGLSEMVTVGRKPSGKGKVIRLAKDSSLEPSHVKLKLYSYAKKYFGLTVEGSGGATFKINGDSIEKIGRASVNDCIKLGDTVLKVLGPL